jgi:hypothetical protein
MLCFFKYFRRKKSPKNWRSWLKRKLNCAKIGSYHCFWEKTPIFSQKIGKNRGKLWS